MKSNPDYVHLYMLTFADFFAKKKIDIKALKKAEPSLYQEFAEHYELMGEKSFDHSKKFWFNRLRKSYLLAEEAIPTPSAAKAAPASSETASKSETAAAKPAGFRPKFKAASAATAEAKPIEAEENKDVPVAPKPAGFQPKFRPKVASAAKPAEEKTQEAAKEETKPATPSGFKPRFKAANLPKKVEESPAEETNTVSDSPTAETEDKPVTTKPAGFKPRFKAANLPKAVEPGTETAVPAIEPPASEKEGEPIPAAKPKGFTPRFKAGLTKTTASPETTSTQPSPDVQDQQAAEKPQTPDTESSEESVTIAAKPRGFTPRFKAKKTAEEGNDSPTDDAS